MITKIRNKMVQHFQWRAEWHMQAANRLMINHPYGSFGWKFADIHLAFADLNLEIAKAFTKGAK